MICYIYVVYYCLVVYFVCFQKIVEFQDGVFVQYFGRNFYFGIIYFLQYFLNVFYMVIFVLFFNYCGYMFLYWKFQEFCMNIIKFSFLKFLFQIRCIFVWGFIIFFYFFIVIGGVLIFLRIFFFRCIIIYIYFWSSGVGFFFVFDRWFVGNIFCIYVFI